MSNTHIDRRRFLQVLGLGGAGAALAGCDMPSYVTLEEGQETVQSYLAPEEYVVPGVGVWYASTCMQCPAACGVHGRVREGRVLKLEGNPDARVNAGKLCQMGQSALQSHFNPDRLTTPLIDGKPATWEDALARIQERTQGAGKPAAWMSGTISGHQRVLMETHLGAIGGARHYAVEAVNAKAWEDACETVLGDRHPDLHLDKAGAVLSVGADLLGTFQSPVHYMRQYGEFRSAPRGVLMAVEPAMSQTGANADHWLGVRPGTEAAILLALGNVLTTRHNFELDGMPSATAAFRAMSPTRAGEIAGVPPERIERLAATLADTRALGQASLVVANCDSASARAAMALNVMLGNVGRTLTPGARTGAEALAPVLGATKDLYEFAADAHGETIGALFVTGVNPAFIAPDGLDMEGALNAVDFVVQLTQFRDETSDHADVVLPLASALEDWGTHVPAHGANAGDVHIQQPLMEPLYADAKGLGDALLALGKHAGVSELEAFDDYYGYLRTAVSALMASELEADWNAALQAGLFNARPARATFTPAQDLALGFAAPMRDSTLRLIAPARQGLYDGRHANLSWLQEAPDQISKAVWDSWVELNPATAARLGVGDGDYVTVTSSTGASVSARVFTYKGVHPDAVAIPMGRGHTAYGPYADNGVNPMKLLSATPGDRQSSGLADGGIAVTVQATGENRHLVRLMDTDRQYGRKLVATIPAQQFRRNNGGA